jgi:hypothetical protein
VVVKRVLNLGKTMA